MNRRESTLLAILLVASLALNFTGIGFGQPSVGDQSVDAIHPAISIDALQNIFGHRAEIGLKYPRLHYLLTGVVQLGSLYLGSTPVEQTRILEEVIIEEKLPDPTLAREWMGNLIVLGRSVSAVMGTFLVLGLFAFARALFGFKAGIISGVLTATSFPFVFYSHTLNLDVPYMCWGIFSLLFAVRAIRRGGTSDLVWAMTLAALAGATKDQAYGWFLLSAPVAAVLLWRPGSLAVETRRAVSWPGVFTAMLISVVVYLLVSGLPFDVSGFVGHFEFIVGPGVEPFRQYEASLVGLLGIASETGGHIVDGLGWPLVGLSAVGVVVTARHNPRAAVLAIAPAVSYFLSFILASGLCYMRFAMPIMLTVVVLAGAALAEALARPRLRWLGAALLAALVVSTTVKSIQLDRMMLNDPRDRATWYFDSHIPDGLHIGVLRIPPQSLVMPQFGRVTVPRDRADLSSMRDDPPDLVVIARFPGEGGRIPNPPTPSSSFLLPGIGRFVLEEEFAPLMKHPVQRGVFFQPTIRVYRRL